MNPLQAVQATWTNDPIYIMYQKLFWWVGFVACWVLSVTWAKQAIFGNTDADMIGQGADTAVRLDFIPFIPAGCRRKSITLRLVTFSRWALSGNRILQNAVLDLVPFKWRYISGWITFSDTQICQTEMLLSGAELASPTGRTHTHTHHTEEKTQGETSLSSLG